MSSKDWHVYLAHARDCVLRIRNYAASGRDGFLNDPMTQDAILRNLEIVGQCVKDAGIDRLAANDPGVAWRRIADFRNVLAHAYLSVSPERIWPLVEQELPELLAAIERQLEGWHP